MLDFPSSPTSGQYYTSSVRSWRYNGTTWVLLDDPWLDADSFSGQDPSYYRNAINLTGLFTGLVGFRYNSTPSFSNTGLGVVLYPQGGGYSSNTQSVTGAIEITTPLSGQNTMLYADVDIYNYSTSKAQKISIGGYLYSSPAWIGVSATTISNGNENPTVRFGYSGDKYKIWIGELTGVWYYPKILVHNLKLGFANNSPEQWSTGWSIDLQTGSFGTISQTVTNTQIGKYHNGSIIWNAGNDGTGSTLDADLLDGQEGVYYRNAANLTGSLTSVSTFSGNTIWHAGNDGAGSTLDADLLDGQHGSYYLNYNNFTPVAGPSGMTVADRRSIASPPTYYNTEFRTEFKQRNVLGEPTQPRGSNTYGGLVTFAPWGDDSGGKIYQIYFNTNTEHTGDPIVSIRNANPDSGSWSGCRWLEIIHSGSTEYRGHLDNAAIHINTGSLPELVQDIVGNSFFSFGTGISGNYDDASNRYAVSGIYASTTTRGVASFLPSQFSTSAGVVTLTGAADGSITNAKLIAGDFSSITGFGSVNKDLTFASQSYKINYGSNLPAGYVQSTPHNFRFDQDVLKYSNRWGTATYNLSGFVVGDLDKLFSQYTSHVNVGAYSDGCSIEVTGISISNSQPASFWPYIMLHSNEAGSVVVKMEVTSSNNSGYWEQAYSGSISKFHIAQYTMTGSAQTPLVGARWTFISKSNPTYVRWLGVIGRNSPEYTWNLMKGGDTIYGNLNFANSYEPTISGAALNAAGGLVKLNSSAQVPIALIPDGAGSTLDSDLLDGQHGSYYLDLTNLTGTTTSSKISDFTEAAQDAIGTSFFTFAGTVTGSYNDGSNTFLLSGIASTGGGVTSHTALTDLTADDHLQYLTSGRADTWLLQNSSFTGFTGSFTSNVEVLISNTQLEDLLDIIYTNSPDEVQYNTLAYNVGGYWEPSKTISTHIAETGYHYTQASILITTGQVAGFTEAVQDIIGTGTFLKGSNGISGIYNDTSNILTLSGIDATYVQRGVASFDSAYFSVTTGKVSLASVPLAVIEQNTGPYILGLSAVGVDDSPSAMSTSTVANLLTGSLTTPSFVTGIVTGLATGYLKVANNLSDVPDLSLTRQNLRVRYNMDDLSPFDSQGIWTSVSAGSGSTYQYDPQYGAAATKEPGAHGIVTCTCNLGSGIGDCSVRYHTNAGLWLSTGSEFYFRAMHTSTLAAGNIFRFGLGNAIANATGQIADGIYFELNGSTGAAIMCCTASGSTYSRTVSSYSPTVAKWTWYIIKFLGTGVAFYTDGNNTPIATIYNNYPGTTARASRAFWQCAGTGLPNYRAIMVDKIAYPYIESSLPSGLYL